MTKLPIISAARLEKALFTLGFARMRQRGSHVFYRHPDGRTTTVPHHGGRDIARPLLREILHDIEVSPEGFATLLREL
jgi:predicted RNA binding protein YcfA (HicA-like mRNA interferase family)